MNMHKGILCYMRVRVRDKHETWSQHANHEWRKYNLFRAQRLIYLIHIMYIMYSVQWIGSYKSRLDSLYVSRSDPTFTSIMY